MAGQAAKAQLLLTLPVTKLLGRLAWKLRRVQVVGFVCVNGVEVVFHPRWTLRLSIVAKGESELPVKTSAPKSG